MAGLISIASHGHARIAGYTGHGSHTGHILHRGTGQISCAIGTEGPAQFEQAFALGARTLELLAAGRADLEIAFDTSMAIVAGLALGHLGQQRLFF